MRAPDARPTATARRTPRAEGARAQANTSAATTCAGPCRGRQGRTRSTTCRFQRQDAQAHDWATVVEESFGPITIADYRAIGATGCSPGWASRAGEREPRVLNLLPIPSRWGHLVYYFAEIMKGIRCRKDDGNRAALDLALTLEYLLRVLQRPQSLVHRLIRSFSPPACASSSPRAGAAIPALSRRPSPSGHPRRGRAAHGGGHRLRLPAGEGGRRLDDDKARGDQGALRDRLLPAAPQATATC